jgi:hypothetical protein
MPIPGRVRCTHDFEAVARAAPATRLRSIGQPFDFPNDTTNPTTQPTIQLLARSTDAVQWNASAVAGSFDLASAPDAGRLFVGDRNSIRCDMNGAPLREDSRRFPSLPVM